MEKSIRRHIILVLLLLIGIAGFAQQDPMHTLYMNDPILINPAYAGSRGNLSMNGVFRKQWVGATWPPTTTSITLNSPFLDRKIGVGFSFMHDQIGPLQQTGIYLDYAYHLRFSRDRNLSLGLKAGFTNFDRDLLNLLTINPDQFIFDSDQRPILLPNFGVGAYYFTEDYYVGFSIPLLLRNKLDRNNTFEIVGREERAFYITAGWVFDLIPPIVKLKPTILARAIFNAPPSIELSATAIMYDRVWFGMLYRIGDAVAVHARVQATMQLQIGYSYDLTTNEFRPHNKGTHEVMLNYVFTRRGQRILSPRYF
jgi:type IX secretion system PorP/SprF family membrane protein